MSDRVPNEDEMDPRVLIGNDKPREIPCHVVRALLPAASGEDVDGETATVVRRHTLECLNCRRELQRFDDARVALASLAEGNEAAPQLDDSFFASLHDGIVGELRRDTRIHGDSLVLDRGPVQRRAAWASWLPVAAALVATLVGGFLVGRSLDQKPRYVGPVHAGSEVPSFGLLADPAFAPYVADALKRWMDEHPAEGPDAASTIPVGDFPDLEDPPTVSKSKDF